MHTSYESKVPAVVAGSAASIVASIVASTPVGNEPINMSST